MRAAFATLAFAALAAAVPQAVTSAIAPSSSPPPGCSVNYNGDFVISPVLVNSKRSLQERNTPLYITLQNGILMDSDNRTGYVASNSQFQFDGPPQAGAIYTAGFSICANGSLAIGGDATWYECLSGTFYNLYLDNQGGQCKEIYLMTTGVNGGSPAPGSGATTSAMSTSTVTTATVAVNGSMSSTIMSTGSGAMNGTMSGSSSGTGGVATTTTTSRTTAGGVTTGAGGMTTGPSQSQQTGGQQTTNSAASASAASSASSAASAGGAAVPTARGDIFGLAAGLLALAVL